MKKVFFAAVSMALVLGTQFSVIAQDIAQDQNKVMPADKKQIKLEELPLAVKQTLTTDAYKEFVAETAAVVIREEKTIYEVIGKRGTVTETLQFGEDGKLI